MPSRARWCGARPFRSRPSKRMVPPSGATVPAIRLKIELLPAPLGPIMPRQVPVSSEKVTPSATTMAPYRLRRSATSRSAGISLGGTPAMSGAPHGECSAELREQLQVGFHPDLRRGGVGDDQQLVGKLAAVLRLPPLTAGQAGEGDVLDRAVLELHRPDDRVDRQIGDRRL